MRRHAIVRPRAMSLAALAALVVGLLLPVAAVGQGQGQGAGASGPWLPAPLMQGHVQAAQALELVSLQLRVEAAMGTDPAWQRAAWDAAVARPDPAAAAAALQLTADRLFAFVEARLGANPALAPADRARAVSRLADARRLWAFARGADSDREPALTRAFEALAAADPRAARPQLRTAQADVANWVGSMLQQTVAAPARPLTAPPTVAADPGGTGGATAPFPPGVAVAPRPMRPGDAIFVAPTPAVAPLAEAGGSRYLGCYRDQGNRDLSGHTLQDARMTTQMCVSECGTRGFAYAGTQFGSHCFCGQRYGASGLAPNCDMACAGNAAQKCGGVWANSIYELAPGGGTAAGGMADPLGTQWSVVENGLDGIWVRRPGGTTFDAHWPRVNVRAVLELTLVGSRVSVLRRRSTDGNDCDYVGQLSGKQVAGTYHCTRHPTPMPWQATIRP